MTSLTPFDLCQNLFLEKLGKPFLGNACMHVVVNLYGNTFAVAFSDAKAACQGDLILEMILLYRLLKQLDYFGCSLEMAGASHTDLDYHLYLSLNVGFKEVLNVVGGYGEEILFNCYANTLLTSAHTEGAAELYLVTEIVLSDKLLELLYYLS